MTPEEMLSVDIEHFTAVVMYSIHTLAYALGFIAGSIR